MDFTLSEQMLALLWSVVLGLILAVIYDFFRFLRILINSKKTLVFIFDVLFMLTAAFLSVYFAVAFSRGSLRYFTLMGELAGFFAYLLTLGRLTGRFFNLVRFIVVRVIKIVTEFLAKTEKKLLQLTEHILYNKYRKNPNSHKL